MVMDEGTKEAIAEQLRLGQELRQKAERMGRPAGSDSDGGGGGDSSTDASDDEGGAYGGRRTTAAARQAAMDILESSGLPDGEVPAKVSGLNPGSPLLTQPTGIVPIGRFCRIIFPIQ